MQIIEVITGEQKRRRYTPEEKARLVAFAMQPCYTVSLFVRKYGIIPSLLFKWKRLMNDGGLAIDQIAQYGLSSVLVIYYMAQLFRRLLPKL